MIFHRGIDTRHLLAGLMAVAASAASCATFPLEWNASYRTDVPYEVEMFPSRVGAESFRVKADGKYLKADQFAGKAPGSVALRFNVPRGTKSLVCETAKRGSPPCDSSKIDNLFAGALDPSNIGRWRLGGGIRASVIDGGICFRGTDVKPGGRYVTYTVDVPEGLAGIPVMQEMDLRSTAKLVWGGKAHIRQLDAKGNALPESVADVRWTSHMRPPRKLAAYRDEGHIHPEAKKLMVELELRTLGAAYDDYGQKISDRSVCLPSLEVTRLAVRPAERLPFPKWNDSFFGGGVSGNPDPGGNGGEKSFTVARYINGNEDYLKANYARKGERARWKWDTVNLIGKQYGQTTYSGWIIRALDFPETDHVDMRIPWNSSEGVELAAVLLLPDPDLECRADLRKVLFGLNCDPFLVR